MTAAKHDRAVVEAFVEHLRRGDMPGINVDRWLEDEFPGTSQVEAIVGPLAVEHTSIDTFVHQRRNGDWFDELVAPIEAQLSPAMPCRIRVFLPPGSVSPGCDWAALRIALAESVVRSAVELPDGNHHIRVTGTEISIRISKDSVGEPALICWLEVIDDGSLPERLRDLVQRKAIKLEPHAARGKTRVLLVESVDGLNTNQHVILKALRDAFDGMPEGVDQLWFVDGTRGLAPLFFNFTGDLMRPKPTA
jgi:hypothetical protein